MNKWALRGVWAVIVLIVIYFIASMCYFYYLQTAIVKNMYEFSNPYQLAEKNMPRLQRLVSPEVMKDISINNERVTLTKYLKFQNKPTSVTIVSKSTKGREAIILFNIKNEHIKEERLFAVKFHMNWSLTVDKLEQFELIRM